MMLLVQPNKSRRFGPLPYRAAVGGTTFTANGIVTGAPTLGTPVLSQLHSLSATSIVTGAPTLGTLTLTQFHSLIAVGVATGAPTLDTPTITLAGQFTANPIVTGAPTLGNPTLTQFHSIAGVAIATGAPTIGTPTLTQLHSLTTLPIVTGAPTLGNPTITFDTFTAVGIATGTPTLGTPTVTQFHTLIALPVTTGTPTIGTPVLGGDSVTLPGGNFALDIEFLQVVRELIDDFVEKPNAVWKSIGGDVVADPNKPFITTMGATTEAAVKIVFYSPNLQKAKDLQFMPYSEVQEGRINGLMYAYDFTPTLKDVVVFRGREIVLVTVDVIQPVDKVLLYDMEFDS